MAKYSGTALQILTAARALFAEEGYDAVSTKKIAETAKVNEVTVFRHFKSKAQLFQTTIEHFTFLPDFEMLSALNNVDFENFLRVLGSFKHKFFKDNLMIIRMELKNGAKIKEKGLHKFPLAIKDLLSQKFKTHKLLSQKEADIAAVCFITSLHGLCMSLYIFELFGPEIKYDACLEQIIQRYK